MDTMRAEAQNRTRPPLWRVAVLAGSVLLASCSDGADQSAQENSGTTTAATLTTMPATTTASTTSQPFMDCTSIPVAVGEFFSADKTDEIVRQVDLINTLRNPDGEITLRELNAASEVIYRSFRDPMYADAADKAIEASGTGRPIVTAQGFLAQEIPRPENCAPNRIRRDAADAHLDDFRDVSSYVITQSGKEVGGEMAYGVKSAWEVLSNQVRSFLEEMER